MKNYIEIRSDPLFLRPLLESDLNEIHSIWTDAYVRKFLFDDVIISIDRTSEEIRNSLSSFEKNGYGAWAAFLQDSPEMIGFTGFRNFNEPPELQLIYGLLPEYSGKGYATKLAKIMIKFGFEELEFDKIIACADVPNAASFRVMEKAGMLFKKRAIVNGLDTVYYEVHRQKYKRNMYFGFCQIKFNT